MTILERWKCELSNKCEGRCFLTVSTELKMEGNLGRGTARYIPCYKSKGLSKFIKDE
jgi:hypothetical protein